MNKANALWRQARERSAHEDRELERVKAEEAAERERTEASAEV